MLLKVNILLNPKRYFLLIKYEEICYLAFDNNNGTHFRCFALFSDHVSWKYGENARWAILRRRDALLILDIWISGTRRNPSFSWKRCKHYRIKFLSWLCQHASRRNFTHWTNPDLPPCEPERSWKIPKYAGGDTQSISISERIA